MDQTGFWVVVVVAGGCVLLFSLAIQAFVCWILSGCLSAIPAEHRRIGKGGVWVLLIPVFSALWNFVVYPRVAASFDSYFRSKGETVPTGQGLALLYCWLVVAGIPFTAAQIAMNPVFRGEKPGGTLDPTLLLVQLAGGAVGMAAFVVWILVLVKFHELKKKVAAAAA